MIRRVFFDMLGLPPTPGEVDAFVEDQSADACENLVDRVLADPRYGERWARHWLDLARFAESHGFEHDYDRPSAYHYRDFVIEAGHTVAGIVRSRITGTDGNQEFFICVRTRSV